MTLMYTTHQSIVLNHNIIFKFLRGALKVLLIKVLCKNWIIALSSQSLHLFYFMLLLGIFPVLCFFPASQINSLYNLSQTLFKWKSSKILKITFLHSREKCNVHRSYTNREIEKWHLKVIRRKEKKRKKQKP